MKKSASAVSVIGGADGPTCVSFSLRKMRNLLKDRKFKEQNIKLRGSVW